VTTTPLGNLKSIMSSARTNALQKSGVWRLSGGEEKVKRYTFGCGWVHVIEPFVESIGMVKRGVLEAMIAVQLSVRM
jgi:hypothetical protein